MSMHIYVCPMYIYKCTSSIYVYLCISMHIYVYLCISMYIYVYLCISMDILCISLYILCISIYIYVYVLSMYIYVYLIYIYARLCKLLGESSYHQAVHCSAKPAKPLAWPVVLQHPSLARAGDQRPSIPRFGAQRFSECIPKASVTFFICFILFHSVSFCFQVHQFHLISI